MKLQFQSRRLLPVLSGMLIGLLVLADAFAETSNTGKLVFLGNRNIAPVVYLDGTTPTGVVVDIVHALAKHLPQPVEVRAMDWPQAQALVARGEADALIQINETEERKKTYDFSDTLLESQFSIFVTTDRVGISGITSLYGLRVGVESGGLPRQILESNQHISLTTIADFLEGFRLLNAGAIDAVVVDYRVGSYVLAQNKLRNIKVAGEPIASSYSSIAVRKGNTRLLAQINNALRTIRADGSYQKAIDKWKPKEAVFQTREQITQEIFYVVILVLLALFIMAALWTLSLRKELRKRKAAETRLREQYSTLRGIINSANALIYSVDRQYRYTSFNRGHAVAMRTLYDADVEEGRSVLDYIVVATDRDATKRRLDRALAGESLVDESYSGEALRSRHYFQVSHSPITAEQGEIIGVAVLAQDMTERKQAEEEIRRLNAELEQRVARRTAQLEASTKELEDVSYSISHDLRAPLRHIDGFVGLLQERTAANLDEKSRHYLATIADAARHMGTLIDDLLSFLRMGRSNMAHAQVDVGALVREVIRELEPETRGRAIDWRIAELPVVTGDYAMLRIVLVNLISNALKFTRERARAEIEIGCLPEQATETRVFVRDNGAGFDMQYADKLFSVFQRLHRAEDFEGMGIGLANVRRIINRHGGKAWAEGKRDGGATFCFSLPRSSTEEASR